MGCACRRFVGCAARHADGRCAAAAGATAVGGFHWPLRMLVQRWCGAMGCSYIRCTPLCCPLPLLSLVDRRRFVLTGGNSGRWDHCSLRSAAFGARDSLVHVESHLEALQQNKVHKNMEQSMMIRTRCVRWCEGKLRETTAERAAGSQGKSGRSISRHHTAAVHRVRRCPTRHVSEAASCLRTG